MNFSIDDWSIRVRFSTMWTYGHAAKIGCINPRDAVGLFDDRTPQKPEIKISSSFGEKRINQDGRSRLVPLLKQTLASGEALEAWLRFIFNIHACAWSL